MNELAVSFAQGTQPPAISEWTKGLIQAGVSENTLIAYQRVLLGLNT